MPLLIVLVALLLPPLSEAETISVSLQLSSDVGGLPASRSLQAQILSCFNQRYGKLVEVTFAASTDSQTPAPAAQAHVLVQSAGNVISVATEMARGTSRKALTSTVPKTAGSMAPTVAGDLAYLWFALGSFASVSPGPPPRLAAVLRTDTLASLTGWQPKDLEPIGLAAAESGIIVCFPHGWLSLGPSFRLVSQTARDVLAQSAAQEPLLLSGVVAGTHGKVFLLTEQSKRAVLVNPRLGTREIVDVPSLTALGGSRYPGGRLAILSNEGGEASIIPYPASPAGPLRLSAAYVSAMDTDVKGDFWVWDAEERRIRIVSPAGQEISAIRPLFDPTIMQLPQQLVAQKDGGFLLGGSAEVWKFDAAGIPVWRLRQSGGRPPESLPPSFLLAAVGDSKDFALLDMPSRRLLEFTESGAEDDISSIPALLARLDARSASDLLKITRRAEDEDLPLMALQFADDLVTGGGPAGARESALASLRWEISLLCGSLGDSLRQELLFDRAERAFQKAADSARACVASSPENPDAGRALRLAEARRSAVHEALVPRTDVELTDTGIPELLSLTGLPDTLRVSLQLRNTGSAPMSDITVSLSIPGAVSIPGAAHLSFLAPGASRTVQARLPVEDTGVLYSDNAPTMECRGYVTWRTGNAQAGAAVGFAIPRPNLSPPVPVAPSRDTLR
jgi:hypothetical protein